MKSSHLKKRWSDFGDTPSILAATKNLTESPFGKTAEVLVDFRGISLRSTPLSVGDGWQNDPHKFDLRRCDFSNSRWEGFDLRQASVEETLFSGATFIGDLRFYETRFSDCVFDNCSFKNTSFTKSSLFRTSFSGLKPSSDLSFNAKAIEECHFSGEMKKISFWASPINRSSFSGTLTDCTFHGHPKIVSLDAAREIYKALNADEVANRMDGADFSDAKVILCRFSNYCHLDKVIPPPMDRNCIVRLSATFFEAAVRLIETEAPAEAREKMHMWLETFYKPDARVPYGVMGPQDFAKYLGEENSMKLYEFFCRAAIDTHQKV